MLVQKQKIKSSSQTRKGNRLLISITVLGSAGPIRFVVYEGDLIATVIETALKTYSREGRLPVLGTDLDSFVLYCHVAGHEALSPWETIGSLGVRNFMLYKKPAEKELGGAGISRKGSGGSLKAWLQKSLNLKVSSH